MFPLYFNENLPTAPRTLDFTTLSFSRNLAGLGRPLFGEYETTTSATAPAIGGTYLNQILALLSSGRKVRPCCRPGQCNAWNSTNFL